MPQDIGFGVVGLGMGKHHCKAIHAAPGARLVAVCDVDEERLKTSSERFQCKAYARYEDMLKDPDISVVNIATPSGMHAAMGIQAANAGKHVIVEKPADIHTKRIDDFIEAGKKNKVKIAGIFQARFDPLNIRIRDAIQSGRMGRLIGVHGHLPWWRAQSYYEGPHGSWKGTWAMDGGGSLMNQGVHTLDLIQWFAGPVAEVSAYFGVFGHQIEAEDHTVAILRFRNGAIGTLYTTTCCYPGFDQRITLFGASGSVIKEEGRLVAWKFVDDPEGVNEKELLSFYGGSGQASASADPMAVGFDGHAQIVMDMVKVLTQGGDLALPLDSARNAVAIITAIYESGKKGKPVKLKEG
jgi:predicted dehydrogenase